MKHANTKIKSDGIGQDTFCVKLVSLRIEFDILKENSNTSNQCN